MASLDDIVAKKVRLFEAMPEQLATSAERAQRDAWRELAPLLNSFDVDESGNIAQTEANIARIGKAVELLQKVLGGGEYADAVKQFLSDIDPGVKLTDDIARTIDESFEPTKAQKQLLQIAKTNAISAFFGTGLRERVIQPFLEQLSANVSARAPLGEAVKALETTIVGNDKTDGRLLANIKTTAVTAQSVADRSYSAAVSDELGIEFFRYVGGEIPTTRPFCEHREGQVFHKKEIEAWGAGKNSGGINDIRDGSWAGRIEQTDSKSIFTFVGGWNCRHQLVPVSLRRVPPEVIARAKAEGFME